MILINRLFNLVLYVRQPLVGRKSSRFLLMSLNAMSVFPEFFSPRIKIGIDLNKTLKLDKLVTCGLFTTHSFSCDLQQWTFFKQFPILSRTLTKKGISCKTRGSWLKSSFVLWIKNVFLYLRYLFVDALSRATSFEGFHGVFTKQFKSLITLKKRGNFSLEIFILEVYLNSKNQTNCIRFSRLTSALYWYNHLKRILQ